MRGLGLGVVASVASFAMLAACSSSEGATPGGSTGDGGPGPTPTGTATTTPPGEGMPDATTPVDAGADADAATPSEPSIGEPDTFEPSEYDTERDIDTTDNAQRRPISPLIYGLNSFNVAALPAAVLRSITFVRRGGDRVNTYDWETNLSANSTEQGNAAYSGTDLVDHLPASDRAKPAALDLDMIAKTRAAGLGAMIPFTLNDYVSSKDHLSTWFADKWTPAGGQRDQWFDRNHPVSTGAMPAEPVLGDGAVYADQHFAYLKAKLGDIYAAGATRVMVGTDNEPDIFHENYPFLQAGAGAAIKRNGVTVGTQVDGLEFARNKFIPFAKRVKELEPNAFIVGPDHYHYDGFTTWEETMKPAYSDSGNGKWLMDDFLEAVKTASTTAGKRLIDIWDFHWYPQGQVDNDNDGDLDGDLIEYIDASTSVAARTAILNSPRGFWDESYDEKAWYTDGTHTNGAAMILKRIQSHVDAHYPGTGVGVSEYWPGGCGYIYSGLGVVDTLGIFQRMNVTLGAMWPDCEGSPSQLDYAYAGFRLVRNADGNGLKFASTYVPVTNPATAAIEKAERALSSVYAGSDDKDTMTVLVVNKHTATRRFALRARHSAVMKTVDIYRIASTSTPAARQVPVFVGTETLTKKNAHLYAAPQFTASLLVFRK